MKKEDKIMRIPQVIWEKDLWEQIQIIANKNLARLQNVSNYLVGIDQDINPTGSFLRKMLDNIVATRRKLNYIDQNLEVLTDLIQYLLEKETTETE